MGVAGLEQMPDSLANSSNPSTCGAESGAVDPDLAAIMAAWTALSVPVKAGIVAMIRAARD